MVVTDRRTRIVEQGMFREKERSTWSLVKAPTTTLMGLFNGAVPALDTYSIKSRSYYETISQAPVSLFSATNAEGKRQSILVGSQLAGDSVLELLSFPAPHSEQGVSAASFIQHYDYLFSNRALRKAHKGMPGWNLLKEDGGLIRKLVQREYVPPSVRVWMPLGEPDFLYPTLRWEEGQDGTKKILLDPPDQELRRALQEQIGSDPQRLDRFNTIMGSVLLAAYSPGQTNWPKYDGYTRENSGTIQGMEGPQMMLFVPREIARKQDKHPVVTADRDIQQSPLLVAMDAHLEKALAA